MAAGSYELMVASEQQVWYVDVGNLGVQRPAATLANGQVVDAVAISNDGRYVATVVRKPASPVDVREVQLLDADDVAPPSRVSLDPAVHFASYEPKFNADGTALYYVANTAFPGESAVYKVTWDARRRACHADPPRRPRRYVPHFLGQRGRIAHPALPFPRRDGAGTLGHAGRTAQRAGSAP